MRRIVFVHLGPSPAEHLWMNISSIKKRFPAMEITVIYSDAIHEPKILGCHAGSYLYKSLNDDNQLFESLTNNINFREGFWRYSVERLIALEAWHAENSPAESFLHVESDILILNNFPFSSFDSIDKLAWIKFNENHDVSALLYSPNYNSTKWLASRIRHEIAGNLGLTDMTVLSVIRRSSPTKVYLLPTISSPTSVIFDGLFDGASIGMWLHGRDPRNHYGFVKRHMTLPDSDDKAEKLRYTMQEGILLVENGKTSFPLFNLHVHSKGRKLFKNSYLYSLSTDVLWSKMRIFSYSFSIRAFLSIVEDLKKRHGVKIFREVLKKIMTRTDHK